MCSREWKEPGLVMASAVNRPFRSPFYASSHFKHHNDSQGEPHSWVGWDPEKNEVTQLPSKRAVQLGFQPGQWILEPGLVSRLHYYAICRDSLDHILKAKETWPAGLDILLSAIENHRDILSWVCMIILYRRSLFHSRSHQTITYIQNREQNLLHDFLQSKDTCVTSNQINTSLAESKNALCPVHITAYPPRVITC